MEIQLQNHRNRLDQCRQAALESDQNRIRVTRLSFVAGFCCNYMKLLQQEDESLRCLPKFFYKNWF